MNKDTKHCCRQCYINSKRKSREQWIIDFESVHGKEYSYELLPDIIIDNKTKVEVLHVLCGKTFWVKPHAHYVQKTGCPLPRCSQQSITLFDIRERGQTIHGMRYVIKDQEVVNMRTKIEVYDIICGNTFNVRPSNFLHPKNPTGCPYCKASKGEQAITKYLKSIKYPFETEKSFPGCNGDYNPLRFDHYVARLHLAIEFNGIQHYRKTTRDTDESFRQRREYDLRKRAFCKEAGINLLIIPYTQIKNIPAILARAIKYYEKT